MTALPLLFAAIVVIFMATEAFTGDRPDGERKKISPIAANEYAKFVAKFDYDKRTVSFAEFLELRKQTGVVVADLRPLAAFNRGRILGAVHLGPDVTLERLASIAPDPKTSIIVYCENSIGPTRMIALTQTALPQIVLLGYAEARMLEPIWENPKNDRKSLPWEGKGGPRN